MKQRFFEAGKAASEPIDFTPIEKGYPQALNARGERSALCRAH
jgi:hypothetical protein